MKMGMGYIKGCVHITITHPRPLFLEGRFKVAAKGSLIKPIFLFPCELGITTTGKYANP